MTTKYWAALAGLGLSLPLDRLTKWLVIENIHFGSSREVIAGFFYLTHVRNTGAAFGLGQGLPEELRMTFFIGASIVAIAIIFSFWRRLAPGEWFAALGLGLILGGAMGNLLDRIQHGEVVDFLHVRLWGGYSWPDFNIADSSIIVGVAILVLELLASEGQTSGATDGSGESSA